MYYLYVLNSANFSRKYTGITENVESRLSKHNSGGVRSKAFKPWNIVYKEKFANKREARLRELELKKNGYKRSILFKKIERALSSIG